MHLLDRLLALLGGKLGIAPVVEQAVMQPVLVDRRHLVAQRPVEQIDDIRMTLHVR
jgi:hypothetical protein